MRIPLFAKNNNRLIIVVELHMATNVLVAEPVSSLTLHRTVLGNFASATNLARLRLADQTAAAPVQFAQLLVGHYFAIDKGANVVALLIALQRIRVVVTGLESAESLRRQSLSWGQPCRHHLPALLFP